MHALNFNVLRCYVIIRLNICVNEHFNSVPNKVVV